MMILRKETRGNYTVIDNEPLQTANLTLKARGMLSTLLSFPDDWHFNQKGLYNYMLDREASVKRALDELEAKGYLTRIHPKRPDGTFADWEWTVRESPHLDSPHLEVPHLDSPHVGNPDLQSNKEQSNKRQSNKESITSGKPDHAAEIAEIVAYLNSRLGTSYRPTTKSTAQNINARLDEGYSVSDFKTVIDSKVAQWGNDRKMREYLRPQTLFIPTNFESYLQSANIKEVASGKYAKYR